MIQMCPLMISPFNDNALNIYFPSCESKRSHFPVKTQHFHIVFSHNELAIQKTSKCE
uniref:Uncharacterized protein n=1 Tax=Anguilla anguilla TaxID=7936 RepID=A0A0E9X1G1_ANGAN